MIEKIHSLIIRASFEYTVWLFRTLRSLSLCFVKARISIENLRTGYVLNVSIEREDELGVLQAGEM